MQNLQSLPDDHNNNNSLLFASRGVGRSPSPATTPLDRRLRSEPVSLPNLKCPRCDSHNTKFCYYNNYNLSQPRHFCKSCRRYWTKGGVLRNVPVGGASRKSKRSDPPCRSSQSSRSKARKISPDSIEEDERRSGSDSSNLTAVAATAPADRIFSDSTAGSFTGEFAADKSHGLFEYGTFADLQAFHLADQDRQIPLVDHSTAVDLPSLQGNRTEWPGGTGFFDVTGGANLDQVGGGFWNEVQWGESDPSYLFFP